MDFNSIQYRIDYSSQVQQAKQQIFPRWGQRFSLQYQSQIGQYTAWQFLATGSLYLPGFVNGDCLVLNGAYQSRDTLRQYSYSNHFPFSRGYSAVDYPGNSWKLGINYHLPLAYPDWGFGNLFYLLRARANIFYDFTRGKSLRSGLTTDFASTGCEIYLDTRWWNQQSLSLGIRYSRLLNAPFGPSSSPHVWEIILPVNLF